MPKLGPVDWGRFSFSADKDSWFSLRGGEVKKEPIDASVGGDSLTLLAYVWRTIVVCLVLAEHVLAVEGGQQVVSFDLLNKLSAKKHRVEIPLGSAYIIQGMRIVPLSCKKVKDSPYKVDFDIAHVEIFVEQDVDEYKGNPVIHQPILLYKGDLTNSTRLPSSPVEHPIYDLILVNCS